MDSILQISQDGISVEKSLDFTSAKQDIMTSHEVIKKLCSKSYLPQLVHTNKTDIITLFQSILRCCFWIHSLGNLHDYSLERFAKCFNSNFRFFWFNLNPSLSKRETEIQSKWIPCRELYLFTNLSLSVARQVSFRDFFVYARSIHQLNNF